MKILQSLIIAAIFMGQALAAEVDLIKKEVAELYASGKYLAAIKSADEYMRYQAIRGHLNYIKGLSYNRLEKFDLAERSLEAAVSSGFKSPDLYYELGQAEYAMREYDQAKRSFHASREGGYKTDASQFYLGSIEDIMENRSEAKKLFWSVAEDAKANSSLRHSSWDKIISYEIEAIEGNEKLSMDQKRNMMEDKVFPLFDRALDHDFNDPLQEKQSALKKKYEMGVHKKRWWSVAFSQDIKYDENVVNESDDATIKKANKESLFYKSELEGSANVTLPWKIGTAMRARGYTTWYEEHDSPIIKANDADSVVPSVKFTRDLKEFLGFELIPSIYGEYSYNRKDYKMNGENSFYSETYTSGLGLAGNWFGIGNTSIEARYKFLEGYTDNNDSKTTSVIATQMAKLPWGHVGIFLYTGTWLRLDNQPRNDTDSHMFRFDYLIPDLYYLYWNPAIAYTLTDTKAQKNVRGTEKLFSPSLKVGKKFLNFFDVAAKWEYMDQDSKDYRTYKYSKSIYGIEATVRY